MDEIYLLQKEALRRGYSHKTISAYCACVNKFFKFCKKEPRKVTKKDIREYLDQLVKKDRSGNTINVNLNALKFLMENILNKRVLIKIKYSKTPRKIPVVLTKDEVKKLIDVIQNPKHKLIVQLMYSAGLRVGEVVKLKKEDLQLDKNYGWVRQGKGKKDRMFIIAKSLNEEIQRFMAYQNVKTYLFKGKKYAHLSTRSVQEIVRKATKKAKINKKAHPHSLRHSFATHLIENGYDINSIQILLGHKNPESTMNYLHAISPNMLKVKSPLDEL